MTRKKKPDAKNVVRDFYENYGWVKEGNASGEDKSFRSFRAFYHGFYSDVTRRREFAQFEGLHGKLLIAGGGDIPDSHLTIARQFEDVTCLDFSQRALDISKEKLGPDSKYINASILDMPLPNDSVDAVFCSHVIYHIHKSQQADAVRQLIRVVRPGGRVVISYSNPRSPQNLIDRSVGYAKWPWRKLKRMLRNNEGPAAGDRPALYFKAQPLRFWRQFANSCELRLLPWQIFSASQEKKYIRSDNTAERFYRWAARIEENHPSIAVRFWSYPLIVLTKHQ